MLCFFSLFHTLHVVNVRRMEEGDSTEEITISLVSSHLLPVCIGPYLGQLYWALHAGIMFLRGGRYQVHLA